MAEIFLAIVGVAYVGLSAWCVVRPAQTARAVGYDLKPGSGQSEYLVVYGGLQLSLGLLFLWPMVKADTMPFALLACGLVHGSLVAFRTLSLILFSNIGSTTYVLAVVEWLILLGTVAVWWYATSGG